MRLFLISLTLCAAISLVAWGQTASSGGSNLPQIPFGQVYKDFQFPLYQNGQLSATFSAATATGITINRAETVDLKIDLYTNGKVTTTVTSPDADLYVADRVLRTKHTVRIERADLIATSQTCDFDLVTKKYLLRQNVKVTLKNFDIGQSAAKTGPLGHLPSASPAPSTFNVPPLSISVPPPQPSEPPIPPIPARNNGESTIDIPGASDTTNSSPSSPIAP